MSKNIVIPFFIISFYCFLQAENLRFEQISTEQGLSQVTIRAIVQDYQGFVWFGTDDGLNRFDGYSCKVYSYNPADPEGLQTNMITSLTEDENRTLWVGTHGSGLYKYNREMDRFVYFNLDTSKVKSPRKKIMSLYSAGNYLWIGTRDEGIIQLNLDANSIENIIDKSTGLSDNFITNITGDLKGNIWASTSSVGINQISTTNNSVNIKNYNIGAIALNATVDNKGNIWIARKTEILKLNPITEEIKSYPYFEQDSNQGSVWYVHYDKFDNSLWAAASGGLIKYDEGDDKFHPFEFGEKESAVKSSLRTLYATGENLLWAGSISSGAFKIDLSPDKFSSYLSDSQVGFAAPGMAIIQDREGYFWAGTFGHGLFQLDSNKNVINRFYQGTEEKRTYVFCILEDNEGLIWYGTIFNGVFSYNKETGKTKNYAPSNSSLNSRGISYLHLDKENQIWAGTHARGLFKYDKTKDDFVDMSGDENSSFTISEKGIMCIYDDTRGNLWIGTEASGLDKIEKETGKLTNYKHDPEDRNSLSHNHVVSMTEDSKGNLWIGTYSGGINKFNHQSENFTYYTTEDGLPNNSINAIVEDENGNLWLTTNKGIVRFNPAKEIFTKYSTPDGLDETEFVQNSFFKTTDKEILFGSINGFIGFYPDKITDESVDYKIITTDFKIGNKPVTIGERQKLEQNIITAEKLNLSYLDNIFEFEFVALNYAVQSSIKYAYKMENFDSEWIITTPGKRFATYTNLDPGNYVFKVKTVDRSGNFSTNKSSIEINISPPFWETWWFYTLVAAVIILIIYSFVKYRINKVLELERLRIGIASDLHDDIGSTLTKLALKADMIQQGLDSEDKTTGLKRISEMSRQVVSTMSDIVWSIDSRNDTFQSMINKMKDFAYGILADKEVKVNFSTEGFDDSKKAPIVFRQNLYLIFKEAVNNVAKHSNATEVNLSLSLVEKDFKLIINDNGNSFEEKEFNVGHGLKNMKLRAEKLKAELNYKNKNGFTVLITGELR